MGRELVVREQGLAKGLVCWVLQAKEQIPRFARNDKLVEGDFVQGEACAGELVQGEQGELVKGGFVIGELVGASW